MLATRNVTSQIILLAAVMLADRNGITMYAFSVNSEEKQEKRTNYKLGIGVVHI